MFASTKQCLVIGPVHEFKEEGTFLKMPPTPSLGKVSHVILANVNKLFHGGKFIWENQS